MTRFSILLAAAYGCGDVTATSTPTPDAKAPGPDATDAPPGGRCNPSAPFGALVPITELNSTADDYGLWISANGLGAYFQSARPGVGAADIYSTTRPSAGEPFAAPTLVANINTTFADQDPQLSSDGLTIYIASSRGGMGFDIYTATRASTAADFGTQSVVANVNSTTTHDDFTWVNATGTTAYIGTTRSGDWDIMRTTRTSASAPWGNPTFVGELNIAGVEDWGGFLTADELTVYFESSRTGALGCVDVYKATRSSVDDGFGTPVHVDELSTASCEWPTWVSADGCEIAIASNRTGGMGGYDLYVAKKPQ